MKSPVLHIRSAAEAAEFVRWAYGQGIKYAYVKPEAGGGEAFSRLLDMMGETRDTDVYVDCAIFWSMRHPNGVNHKNLCHVNSLTHLKAYLSRMKTSHL